MTSPDSRSADSNAASFPEACSEVVHELKWALTGAFGRLDVDPGRPQEVSRRLDLHRNLTWKVSKIVTGTNPFAAVPLVPGRGGVEILCAALRKAGVDDSAVRRIEAAMDAFEAMIRDHVGDRATLDLVAGGFVPDASQRDTHVQARKKAFLGNSATWSVQARVLMSLTILAPCSTDPARVDVAQIHGLVDLRRLRPDVSWPLFRLNAWDGTGNLFPLDGVPLDADAGPSGVPLLRGFCSPRDLHLDVHHGAHGTEFDLPAGPVGRLGDVTVVYGMVTPSAGPQDASEGDTLCELASHILTPVERFHGDLLVHESLEWALQPRSEVLSLLEGRPLHGPGKRPCTLLPGETGLDALGSGIAALATPHVPRYDELLTHVFGRLGWDEREFEGFRLSMPYPPLPSATLFTMDLRTPDGAA